MGTQTVAGAFTPNAVAQSDAQPNTQAAARPVAQTTAQNYPVFRSDAEANAYTQKITQEKSAQGVTSKDYYTNTPTETTLWALELPDGTTTYYNEGVSRQKAAGTSGADEDLITSDEDYAALQGLKTAWADANAAGDTALAETYHRLAEAIRAGYGYSGDDATRQDGGGYTPVATSPGAGTSGSGAPAAPGSGSRPRPSSPSPEDSMRSLLDEWKAAALEQTNGQVDYSVAQAVTELERALKDAEGKYKEQAESVTREERQALDNSALYAEARGDKGGIGHSQYNEIQAAAAQNRLAVQQAQTKLATDTARQIADLRAQGEFEKADKALEITQAYLSQLMSLEQWAAEFNLTQQQFQESIRQWEAEYELAMKEFELGAASAKTDQLASIGSALLDAGIPLDAEQLAALGMTESQMQQYLMQRQLESTAPTPAPNPSPDPSPDSPITSPDQLGAAAADIFNTLNANPSLVSPAFVAALIEENESKLSEAEQAYLLSLVGH